MVLTVLGLKESHRHFKDHLPFLGADQDNAGKGTPGHP